MLGCSKPPLIRPFHTGFRSPAMRQKQQRPSFTPTRHRVRLVQRAAGDVRGGHLLAAVHTVLVKRERRGGREDGTAGADECVALQMPFEQDALPSKQPRKGFTSAIQPTAAGCKRSRAVRPTLPTHPPHLRVLAGLIGAQEVVDAHQAVAARHLQG